MTPSSSARAIVSRSEKTWKPPESVRIGPSQPMKRCRPPSSSIEVLAGPEVQVVRVREHDRGAELAQLVGIEALDGRLRPHRHERRRRDVAVRGVEEPARAAPSVATSVNAIVRQA